MQAAPVPPEGVRLLALESPLPPFSNITARLGDLATERVLSRELRSDPPDILHLHGFGNTGSTSIPWLAGRLGVPSLVSLDFAEAFCHRGDLIDYEGRSCERVDEPARCLQCCLSSFPGGLSPLQSRMAKALRGLGGLSPYPNLVSCMNRLDLVLGGLGAASLLILENAAVLQRLSELGIAARSLRISPAVDADAAQWLELYASCLEGSASIS